MRKSVNKDYITGLKTEGQGLACGTVYLSLYEEKVTRNSFTFGEKFYLNFENIEGFKKEGNSVFPGMELLIIGKEGDTIMNNRDLYANNVNGFEISPLLLQANITVGNPLHSQKEYTLYANIWDKKGKGNFKAALSFDVLSNKRITTQSKNASYNDIYLFSEKENSVIITDEVKFNETIYMIFEGLEGFTEDHGMVLAGLRLELKDALGKIILKEDDLIGESGMSYADFNAQLAPNFILTGSEIKNPVTCRITIWDKKNDTRIDSSVLLNVIQ